MLIQIRMSILDHFSIFFTTAESGILGDLLPFLTVTCWLLRNLAKWVMPTRQWLIRTRQWPQQTSGSGLGL